MRLDKFLHASRLVKRRTLANRLCDAGRVTLNGRRAKPAAEVEPGDVLGLTTGTRRLVVKILRLPSGRPGPEPAFEIVEDRRTAEGWWPPSETED
jgi:ribosomal 50S subunit-recycling heat shock protein